MTYAIVNASSARHGFVGAPAALGVIGEFRLPARRLEIRRIDTPTVTALIVDLERDFEVAGNWFSPDVHYFDMSLIPRPPSSRGCFEDVFAERQTYGKIFVAPAGYRLSGEGGPECLQHSLNVFVRAHPLFPDEDLLGDNLAPLLKDCLRFKSEAVRHILERIASEVAQPGFAFEILVEGLGLTLLAESARMLQTRLGDHGHKGGLPLWRIKLIEARVRDGERPPSIAELAELCGLSRRQLTRAYREETGRTVSAFVQDVTVERAKTLLTDTDRPIRTVAHAVGFTNPAAFTSAFRRATGQTPRAYRQTRRGIGPDSRRN